MSDRLLVPSTCKVCGGTSLTWDHVINTTSGVQEGRLRSSEIRCQFFLGCDNCSETLKVVSADKIAAYLTAPLLAQPDCEPKPVAYLDEKGALVAIGEVAFKRVAYIHGPCRAVPHSWQPLFTHPAPAGVVLPDERTIRNSDIRDEDYGNGWNNCLYEVARLNGVKK